MLEVILSYLRDDTTLLFKWQTLLGAIAGPVLAFLLSVFFTSARQARKEIKENIRRIEIALTTVLNDIYEIRESLKNFIENLKGIVAETKAFNNNDSYFLIRAVFPPLKEIAFDSEISVLRSRSLYLHNKLVWISGGVRNANISVNEIKEVYRGLIEDNQRFSVSKLMTSQQQRETYIQSLESFVIFTENFLEYLEKGIEMLVQAKVFNLRLKEGGFRWMLWRYEGISFKYFKNKKEIVEYKTILNMQNRIDEKIQDEVAKLLKEAERRIKERNEESDPTASNRTMTPKFITFLKKAKKHTYASQSAERVDSSRVGSKDYEYTEGEFTYHDTYFGGTAFIGEEIVYESGVPIWGMNYYGQVLDDAITEDDIDISLRGALSQDPEDILPVRGPKEYTIDDFTYTNTITGTMESFEGIEEITKAGKKIYSATFHGGIIK